VPAVLHDGVVYTAGMTPRQNGKLTITGVVGSTVSIEQARAAAGLAAANALAAARSALSTDMRCLRMTVYIACVPGFHDLSMVADGASEAISTMLGQHALPARSAIGVQSLPSDAPVEVELIAAAV
jgi:enamine deaminase RidA (YjgF/YER057c/UK114 family)